MEPEITPSRNYMARLALAGEFDLATALTKEVAEKVVFDGDDSLDIGEFTTMEDGAAEIISKYKGYCLSLGGLTKLSDAAAESLSKHEGRLELDGLSNLSVEVAAALAKHGSHLTLEGLTTLSVEVAEALAKGEGYLALNGLTSMSVEVAEALAHSEGGLGLNGLTSISVEVAAALAKCKGYLFLDGFPNLSIEVHAALAKCEGVLCLKSRSKPLVFTMPDHDAISKGVVLSEVAPAADLLNRQDELLLANCHEANPIDSLLALDDRSQLSPEEAAVYDRPISDLNLSVRARKCMVRLRMNTIGELLRKTGDEMLECKNFGVTSLNEVREKLEIHGLKLRGD